MLVKNYRHILCVEIEYYRILPDGPEQNSSKLLSIPFVEDPQHRLQWIAYLEFTHNNEVGDLTWDKVLFSMFLYPRFNCKAS